MDQTPDIRRFSDYLNNIANTDGMITEEEKSIINNVEENLSEYKEILLQAKNDNESRNINKLELFQARMRILQKAMSSALEDKKVSDDEKALINGVQIIISELEKLEKEG